MSSKNLTHSIRKIEIPDADPISPIQWIKQVVDNLNAQVLNVDLELVNAAGADNSVLSNLSASIHEILQKSIQAQSILQEISADEKLTTSINAKLLPSAEVLRKIQKLVESLKELETELLTAEFDYYRIISELLIDVQQQMAYFTPYSSTPHIIQIQNKVNAIETELRRQIQWNFRELGQLVPSLEYEDESTIVEPSIDITTLSQVYLVIDALGIHFRKDLMERFSQLQLIPYEKLFASGTKYSGLDFLDRRYAWFKRLLKAVDDKVSSLFPSHWMLPFYLYLEFARRTKKHIGDVLKALEKSYPDPNTHVQILLKALKSIITFEAEMKTSFNMYAKGMEEEIQIEYADSLSEAFDPYLGPYVQLEREELEKLMDKIIKEETNPDGGSSMNNTSDESGGGGPMKPGDPFVSSRKMFEFIKKSLKRCTGYSTGQTYLALSKEYRICLHNYAESLKFRCPSPQYTKPGKPLVYVVTPDIEETLCRIVVTGEYCIDTVPQLEAMMKNHIQNNLKDEVDFSGQIDSFNDMVAFTLGILTQGITQRLYSAFKNMREMNWSTMKNVSSEESPYVKEAIAVFNQSVPRIRIALSSSYFQGFCMKLVTATMDTLLDNIWKLRRVTQTGAGQLLLDLNGFKEYLLRMPNVRLENGKDPLPITNAYKTFVNTRIQNIQTILKLVCTDDDKLEEMFGLLWPDAKPSDIEAVQLIKGKSGILDPVGDKLKEGAEKIGTTVVGHKAMGDIKSGLGEIKSGLGEIKSGFKAGFGGFKNAFGDIKAAFSGDLFEDGSSNHGYTSTHGHNNVSTHGRSSNHGNSSSSSGGANTSTNASRSNNNNSIPKPK